MGKTILYQGVEIDVSDEVATFLEQDRKRMQAQERSDCRHLSKSSFEQLEATKTCATDADYVFNLVSKSLRLEKLQTAMETLSTDEQNLIDLYYVQRLSMSDIGAQSGVSKMAVSKRLNKLLLKLGRLMET